MPTLASLAPAFAQRIALSLAIAGVASVAVADPYDAPAGYYNSATGTGSVLKSQLHNIIDNHTDFSYGAARSILQVLDADPNTADHILLVYNRQSLDVSDFEASGVPGWEGGNIWNREHTWPRSRGIGTSGDDNTDLHNLRAASNPVNGSRGNKNFGGSFGQPFGAVSGTQFWYPGDADAGMVARQMFYMAVRYDGSDSSTTDLELGVGDTSQTNRLGDLNAMIDWHYRVSPDTYERRRNDIVYDDYQGNRNPFVDRPEFVWSVFVDQANDTQLTASTSSIDLGRVYVGGATPATQSVTVNKGGVDGTYYGVTTTGAATTSAGDQSRALALGAGVSDSFDVGLNVSTATSGLFSGSVVIDNLDVTTGVAGAGANDVDDVIDLSFAVLDHPVASFASGEIVSELTIDFGELMLGEMAADQSVSLFNYDGLGAPALAADLDVDSVISGLGAGDFQVDLVQTLGVEQGASIQFDASFLASEAGVYETTYTINLSGEDLPGEQQQTLLLTLLGEIVGGLEGDYNVDGTVDAADYTIYRDTFGSTVDLRADGDGSGEIDAADLAVWSGNFGATTPTSGFAVPEPATGLLMAIGLLPACRVRQPRRARSA